MYPGGKADGFAVDKVSFTIPASSMVVIVGENGSGKSNRWFWKCVHCDAEVLHRDSHCLNHLSNVSNCKSAPPEVRARALKKISDKVETDVAPGDDAQSILGGNEGNGKKRKTTNGSIKSFVDQPIGEERQGKLDRKLILLRFNTNYLIPLTSFFLSFALP